MSANKSADMSRYTEQAQDSPLHSFLLSVALPLLVVFVYVPNSNAQASQVTSGRTNSAKGWNDLSVDELRQAAIRGDVTSEFYLGRHYELGKGVLRDLSEATKWYRSAAEHGHATAQNNLGHFYLQGTSVPQSDTEAVKWFRKSAEQGEALGQANLGYMYQKGKGVQRDLELAFQWIQKAADQSLPWAQLQIAERHLIPYGGGDPGPHYNPALGFKWLRKAADGGNVAAIAELADAYFMGRGTKVDLNAAIDCLRKAADTGHAGAQVDLAGQYAFGNGEPRGPDDTPVALLKKAADSGNASALQSLADRYRLGFGVPKDLVKAIELYRRAGDDDDRRLSKGRRTPYWSHDLTAQVLDDKGTPLPQETTELNQFAEIVRIYDLAKDRRDVRAEVRLASLYEQGEVVPHSLVFCYAWYSLAAKQGDKEAEAKLNQLRPRLSGEDMEKVTSFVRGLTVTRFSPDSTQSPNP